MKIHLFILPLVFFSCMGKTKNDAIDKLRQNDRQLETPKEGQWLYDHNELGQTLSQYKAIQPVSPNHKQNKIYLLPLGELTKAQKNVVTYTADYLQLFFGLKTIVLKSISDKVIPKDFKRIREDGSVQLLAPYILDSVLKKRIPVDAIALMAVTEKDLYPKPSWNFVFGLATLKDRVGVSSIYRYSKETIDSTNYSLCLQRLISTSSHEIGHMFSMLHCTYAVCVMNGSNSLAESDSRPNRLCSQCLGKLRWNLKFDLRKRIQALDSFFLRHKLMRDYRVAEKDLQVIQ